MNSFKGLAGLRTPSDLVRKLEFDLERLEKIDTQRNKLYAAFDFFVTAEHILDWKYPDDGKKRSQTARREVN